MVTVEDIMQSERRCHLSRDFEEFKQCQLDLNDTVKEYLVGRFGFKGRSCNEAEFDDRLIGNFIQKSISAIGLTLDDIQDITLDCERGRRNVFALDMKDGHRIWVKASGSNRPIGITEILITNEVADFADMIGEDTPHVIYQDVPNRLIAISHVQGGTLRDHNKIPYDFSPTEIATNTLFEIFLMDGDRDVDNVRSSEHIISEIDFASINPTETLDRFLNSKLSNRLIKRNFLDMKRIREGQKPIDEQWTRDYIRAQRQIIDEFRQLKGDIKHVSPNLTKWNMENAESIYSEVEAILDQTEQALNS